MPQKIYQFKAEGSEIKPNPLCLENISKDFAVNDMKKRIKWMFQDFSTDLIQLY